MSTTASAANENGVMSAVVTNLHRSESYTFSKDTVERLTLVAGIGVADDVHAGATVKHRSRVANDPTQPNLRQVHLLQGELLDELQGRGFDVRPGAIGENVTTRGIDLLSLPVGAVLRIGSALLGLTGLRNPCGQLNGLAPGLHGAITKGARGREAMRAGVMTVVLLGGDVHVNDSITFTLPPLPHVPLDRV